MHSDWDGEGKRSDRQIEKSARGEQIIDAELILSYLRTTSEHRAVVSDVSHSTLSCFHVLHVYLLILELRGGLLGHLGARILSYAFPRC